MWFSVCDNVEVHEGDIFLLLCYNQKAIIISKDIFPGGSDSKESACDAGDLVLNPGLGRSPGEGNGNTRQYSWQHTPVSWRIQWTKEPGGPWGPKESDVTEGLTLSLSRPSYFPSVFITSNTVSALK